LKALRTRYKNINIIQIEFKEDVIDYIVQKIP